MFKLITPKTENQLNKYYQFRWQLLREPWRMPVGSERDIQCIANNCLDGFKSSSTCMVMCNPPFHQQQAITDHIAWQMFCDAKQILNQDGKLLVI